MKHLFFALLLMGAGFLTITSCDKDEEGDPTPAIKCNVGGVAWEATSFSVSKINGRLEIAAVGKDTSDLLIILSADTVRPYLLASAIEVVAFRPKGGNWHTSQLTANLTNNVAITKKDTTEQRIDGTFAASVNQATPGTASVTISGGIFTYLQIANAAAPAVVDALTYTVNGSSASSTVITSNIVGLASINGTSTNGEMSMTLNAGITGVNPFTPSGILTGIYAFGGNQYELENGQCAILRNDPIAKQITLLFYCDGNKFLSTDVIPITNGFANFTY